jgi:hypothetical protein
MLAVVGVIALAVLASAVALWPRGELPRPAAAGQADATRLVSATLTRVDRVECPEADPGVPGPTPPAGVSGLASAPAWPW